MARPAEECEHSYNFGVCIFCSKDCEHDFQDNECLDCGKFRTEIEEVKGDFMRNTSSILDFDDKISSFDMSDESKNFISTNANKFSKSEIRGKNRIYALYAIILIRLKDDFMININSIEKSLGMTKSDIAAAKKKLPYFKTKLGISETIEIGDPIKQLSYVRERLKSAANEEDCTIFTDEEFKQMEIDLKALIDRKQSLLDHKPLNVAAIFVKNYMKKKKINVKSYNSLFEYSTSSSNSINKIFDSI